MDSRSCLSINAEYLSTAQLFYEKYGFIVTPTPWLVTKESYIATCPPGVVSSNHLWKAPNQLYHVASAEQGFIEMQLRGDPIPQKAQSTTPCFRYEQKFDKYHLPFFYKLELFDRDTSHAALSSMTSLARQLFATLGVDTHLEATGDGSFDLVTARGLELGSYGIRHLQGHEWTYGTGLALPRFEQALQKNQSSATE